MNMTRSQRRRLQRKWADYRRRYALWESNGKKGAKPMSPAELEEFLGKHFRNGKY